MKIYTVIATAIFLGIAIGIFVTPLFILRAFPPNHEWQVVKQKTNENYSGINFGYIDDAGCVYAGFTNLATAEAAMKKAKQIHDDPITAWWEIVK